MGKGEGEGHKCTHHSWSEIGRLVVQASHILHLKQSAQIHMHAARMSVALPLKFGANYTDAPRHLRTEKRM